MDNEHDFASDSDESDEDFCPEKNVVESDVSVESDASEQQTEEENSDSEQKKKKSTKRGKKQSKKRTNKKTVEEDESDDNGESCSKRRTTRARANVEERIEKTVHKLEHKEPDVDEKKRMDALWADFLSDVKPEASQKAIATTSKSTKDNTAVVGNGHSTPPVKDVVKEKTVVEVSAPKKTVVTEVFDFAGEEVRVQKVVNADSIKENKAASEGVRKGQPKELKRPMAACSSGSTGSGSGLSSILDQIGKKKKISVLEKTKLDWNNFKQDEGIEEEIQTFNKGRNGYLERQDFLQRTDVRQFEIEKSLRNSRRKQ